MDIFSLVTVASFVIISGYWLEAHTQWAAHISGIFLIIVMAAILGNAGLIPIDKAAYQWGFEWAVPAGICCMLLAFDPRCIIKIRKDFIVCFILGIFSTAAGAFISGLLFKRFLPDDYWRVAAQLSASFVGGYENAIAVGETFKTPASVFSRTFAGDSLVTSLWIIANIFYGRKINHQEKIDSAKRLTYDALSGDMDVLSLAITIGIVCLIFLINLHLKKIFSNIPEIFWISILSTIVTLTPIRRKIHGSYVFGSVMLSYFAFSCGAISNIPDLVEKMSFFFIFPVTIVAVHAVCLFGFARLLKIDRDIAIVASQALIGGPATALAVVNARKWNYQLEAVTLGLLGYTIANYIGFFVGKMLYMFK